MLLLNYNTDIEHKEEYISTQDNKNMYSLYCFNTPFQYWYDGKFYSGQKGDVIIYLPGATIHFKPSILNPEGINYDQINVEASSMAEIVQQYPLPLNQAFASQKDMIFRGYIRRITPEWDYRNPGYELIISGALTELYLALYRIYTLYVPYDGIFSEFYTLRKEIIATPQTSRTLEDMAELTGYSVCRFSQIYNQLFGISPINDVIVQRINLAKRLLIMKHYSISDVADMCGFHSLNYFSRCFRKHTGRTPTQYIKSTYK